VGSLARGPVWILASSGWFAGGQAEYMRVPYADVGPIKIPDGLSDEQVLFLSDIFPTGYMAADFCNFKSGETVAIWGCGPVGQFAIRSAFLLGAERVIAIDSAGPRSNPLYEGKGQLSGPTKSRILKISDRALCGPS
jgi:threonine dehydrogenase-like Zn-dependent dehydrogenase